MIVIAIILSAALIGLSGIAAIILFCRRQRKYDRFILQNSLCLQELNAINKRYRFFPYKFFDQCHTYDNENFFNDISCKDYLIYRLQYIQRSVTAQIGKINTNRQLYENYLKEIASITRFGRFQTATGKLKEKILLKKEQAMIKKQTRSTPATRFALTVTLYCSKINGRIYRQKHEQFSAAEVETLIARLNKKRGTYYSDPGIWNAICRVERGRVSNKMRFSVYVRDGYRCRMCGISGRYARLEIDHIIPISKGGKSTYDNLQTLCHSCNVKKGNRIY